MTKNSILDASVSFIATAVMICCGTPRVHAQQLDVDWEKALMRQFNVSPALGVRLEGTDKTTGPGFHAKPPDIQNRIRFKNIRVERFLSVKLGDTEPKELPWGANALTIPIPNCLENDKYHFHQTLTYETTRSVHTNIDQKVDTIQNFTTSTGISGGFLNYFKISTNDRFSNQVTFSSDSRQETAYSDTLKIVHDEDLLVPPRTEWTVIYADRKRQARIPVTMKVLIDGQEVKQEIVIANGEVWYESVINTLEHLAAGNDELRTITVTGNVDVLGTDGELKTAIRERKLATNDPACAVGPPVNLPAR